MLSPQSPKVEVNIKAEKEAPEVLIDPINMDLNNKIRKKEKVVQPSNMKFNIFINYWRPVPHKKFSALKKKTPAPAILRNNYKPKPKREDGRPTQKFNRK